MSEPQKIRIVSDGTAMGTKVFTASGEDISSSICGVSIHPVMPGGVVRATIDFARVDLDVTAEVVKRVPPPVPMPDIGGLVGGKRE